MRSKFKKEAQFLHKFTVQLLNFCRYVKMYHTCIVVPAARGTLFHAQKMVASLQKPWPANMKTHKEYTINTGQMGKNWMTLFTQDPMAGLFDFTPCIYLNEGKLVVNLSEMLIFWTIFFFWALGQQGLWTKERVSKIPFHFQRYLMKTVALSSPSSRSQKNLHSWNWLVVLVVEQKSIQY